MIFNIGKKNAAADNTDKKIAINKNRCPQNHKCPSVKICPVGALSQDGYNAPTVDHEKCVRCGKCVKFCPMKAINFE